MAFRGRAQARSELSVLALETRFDSALGSIGSSRQNMHRDSNLLDDRSKFCSYWRRRMPLKMKTAQHQNAKQHGGDDEKNTE